MHYTNKSVFTTKRLQRNYASINYDNQSF